MRASWCARPPRLHLTPETGTSMRLNNYAVLTFQVHHKVLRECLEGNDGYESATEGPVHA